MNESLIHFVAARNTRAPAALDELPLVIHRAAKLINSVGRSCLLLSSVELSAVGRI